MPISQMRNGLTAENSIFSQKPSTNVPRSRFDLSMLNVFTSSMGMIVPVDLIPVMPNDDFDLSCQYRVDFKPMIAPTFTSYKCKVHYYYCRLSYLWVGWEPFITKGRSGNLSLAVPKIKLSDLCSPTVKLSGLTDPSFKTADGDFYPFSAQSLAGYLVGSVPYDSVLTDENKDSFVNDHYLPYIDSKNTPVATGYKALDSSALPFLMYQKIYRSNYMDPNLYANDVVKSDIWFPDDIDSSDWRINYSPTNLGGTYNELFVPRDASLPSAGTEICNFVPIPQPIDESEAVGDNAVNLLQLRYAMFTDDRFTTALPFLQRGTPATLDITASSDSLLKQFYLIPNTSDNVILGTHVDSGGIAVTDYDPGDLTFNDGTDLYFTLAGSKDGSKPYGVVGGQLTGSGDATAKSISLGVNFTAQQLRNLIALSVWQERNALTNGSYGQFTKVHFDQWPGNEFCEPEYLGGCSSYFNVSSVVQTSATGSGETPQGYQAGIAGTSKNNYIRSFHVPDWGYIMAVMMIIPDTIYVQNQDHWQFDELPDDFYMPEYENLSYQPILNKELFVSGTNVDDDIFGYMNRYVYLKQRDSIARGRLALPASIDVTNHAYVQSRQFSDTPVLSQSFVTAYPPNLDRSMLCSPNEPDFLVQFYSQVKAVRRLSYVAQPNTFGF